MRLSYLLTADAGQCQAQVAATTTETSPATSSAATTVILGGQAEVIVDDQLYYCQLCLQKVHTDKSSNISDIKTYAVTSSTDSLRKHLLTIHKISRSVSYFSAIIYECLAFSVNYEFYTYTFTDERREWVNFDISKIISCGPSATARLLVKIISLSESGENL